MRPDGVVIIAPGGQFLASVREAVDDFLIQASIPQAAVEAVDHHAANAFDPIKWLLRRRDAP